MSHRDEPARLPLRVDLQALGPGLVLLHILNHSTTHSKYPEKMFEGIGTSLKSYPNYDNL